MRSRRSCILIWLTLGMLVVSDACPSAAWTALGATDDPQAVQAAAKDRTWTFSGRFGRFPGLCRKQADSPFASDVIVGWDVFPREIPIEAGERICGAAFAADGSAARGSTSAHHLRI